MYKKLIAALLIAFLTSVLVAAQAGQDEGVEAPTATSEAEAGDVLDQPVDFSSPEAIDKSIEKVRQEAGEAKAREMKVAMKYILTYDLSVGHDKEKMYKRLNGSTPNEIIARMKR